MTRIYIEKITDLGFAQVGKNQSAAARVLLRQALSEDFGFCGELEFTHGANGKPYLSAVGSPWFNLSHSGELVACAVSDEGELGLDIQRVSPARLNVAARVFTAEQCRELNALQGSARDARFCELWVLREAAIKARGGSVLEREAVATDAADLVDAPEGYRSAVCLNPSRRAHTCGGA